MAHFTPVRVAHNVPESLAHYSPVKVVHYTPVYSHYDNKNKSCIESIDTGKQLPVFT